MKVVSPVFSPNDVIPATYTCDGDNRNPPLEFVDVPSDAKSLALIVHDPDAPGGDFVHWLIWNIPIETEEIAEGSVPTGAVEGITDFGTIGYGGPCPPAGMHRYVFELYALRNPVNLSAGARRKQLLRAINEAGIAAKAELVGQYQRRR